MSSHFNFQHYKGMIENLPSTPHYKFVLAKNLHGKGDYGYLGGFTQLQIGEFLTPCESRGDNGSCCLHVKWCLNVILQPLHVTKT